jgi:hypothetical protein
MRIFPRTLRFWTALIVLTWWCALQTAPAAAGLVQSRTSGATSIVSTRDADLIVVQRMLENRVVAQKLHDYGVSPSDVQLRLATTSDHDLHTLATASKGLPSGGDDAIGLLIGVLLIVVLVIVIMKLMNKEIVVR